MGDPRSEADGPQLVVPGVWRVEVPTRTLPPFVTTNAYVLARRGVALVVDPGGDAPDAVRSIVDAVHLAGADAPKGIVLTHTHGDHRAGVPALQAIWPDAALYAHPLELDALGADAGAKGLAGRRRLTVGDDVVEAVHLPGHSRGHIGLWLERARLLLAGDLVAGAGSVWVGVPDGDVADYLDSLARAAALDPAVIGPGHGPVRHDGAAALHDARAHRLAREAEVVAALGRGPRDLPSLREDVYGDLPPGVADFAERSLLAHLRKLMTERRVMHAGEDERGPYLLTPGSRTALGAATSGR